MVDGASVIVKRLKIIGAVAVLEMAFDFVRLESVTNAAIRIKAAPRLKAPGLKEGLSSFPRLLSGKS